MLIYAATPNKATDDFLIKSKLFSYDNFSHVRLAITRKQKRDFVCRPFFLGKASGIWVVVELLVLEVARWAQKKNVDNWRKKV